mgnify:CR=1 FL=1
MLEIHNDHIFSSGQILKKNNVDKIYYKTLSLKTNDQHVLEIFILHDLLKYHDPYLDFAQQLLSSLEVPTKIILFDLSGHGLSTGTRGHIDSVDEYIDDIKIILDSFPVSQTQKRLIISEGFSALLILDYIYANHEKVKGILSGVILAIPALKLKSLQNVVSQKTFTKYLPKMMERVRVPFVGFFTEKLLYKSFLRFNVDDPLVMKNGSLKMVQEIYGLSTRIRPMPYLFDLPFLFLLNNQDALLDIDLVKVFFKGLTGEKSQLLEYDESKGGAFLLEKSHEILGAVVLWIKQIF